MNRSLTGQLQPRARGFCRGSWKSAPPPGGGDCTLTPRPRARDAAREPPCRPPAPVAHSPPRHPPFSRGFPDPLIFDPFAHFPQRTGSPKRPIPPSDIWTLDSGLCTWGNGATEVPGPAPDHFQAWAWPVTQQSSTRPPRMPNIRGRGTTETRSHEARGYSAGTACQNKLALKVLSPPCHS